MKKVLLVHSEFPHKGKNYGGAKKMITWLGNALAEKSFDVTFCSVYGNERADSFDERTSSIELNLSYSESFFTRNVLFFFSFTKAIKKYLKSNSYDVVISFGETSYFVLLLFKYFYKYKLVVSERLDPNNDGAVFNRFRRFLYRYVDILVCQTVGAKCCFSKKAQEHAVVIPNPVNIPVEIWSYDKNIHSICTSGRLDLNQKRQDVLLKGFAKFLSNHKDYTLNIYGGGPDDNKLKDLSINLGISNNVNFWGHTRDINQHLKKNTIFVLSSDFEGIPNALLEAMALGMPVISTKCSPGGAELLIKNKENGLLIDCGDSEALAEALDLYASDINTAIFYANNARKSMEAYDPNIIIKMWTEVLE